MNSIKLDPIYPSLTIFVFKLDFLIYLHFTTLTLSVPSRYLFSICLTGYLFFLSYLFLSHWSLFLLIHFTPFIRFSLIYLIL